MDNRPTTEQLPLWDSVDVWQNAHVKKLRLPAKLATLRQKLYRKAKLEPRFRFYTLYDRIYRRDVLDSAYRIVRINKGGAGVDGVAFSSIESSAGGIEGFLDEIQESLRTKTYKPMPVRRVWIPKPDGRKRPLGIPTIRDRVIQTAALLIIEPVFEADFMDCSHGFRPKRSTHGALKEVREHLGEGLNAVCDVDLKGYFDSIPHEKLLKCLRMRIADGKVLKLVLKWLRAPIEDREADGKKRLTRSRKGTPQGGVVSPLLANVYLHWFEKVFYSDKGPGGWAGAHIVRYADDFVVMARHIGTRIHEFIESKIEGWLDLQINREKTKFVNVRKPGAKLDFLGFTFRYERDLKGRNFRYLNVTASKKAVAAQRDKIRSMISARQSFVPLPQLIVKVNRQLTGWAGYFSFGYPRKTMREMNRYVRIRMIRHLRRRSQRPFRPPKGTSYYKYLKQLGLVYL